jgi:predicted Zn finger-like uncharacterized protein
MNVTCPHCGTIYRVDPRKVPSGGVRARCASCHDVFEVASPAGMEEPQPPATNAGETAPAPVTAPSNAVNPPESANAPEAETESEPAPVAESAPSERQPLSEGMSPEAEPTSEPPPVSEPVPAAEAEAPAEPLPPSAFGSADPHARARRLARALVSDIVVYNPERRDRSLQQGTIRQEFREEIRKSWDEYAAQVGNQLARETSYFRDALNEILAGGTQVF